MVGNKDSLDANRSGMIKESHPTKLAERLEKIRSKKKLSCNQFAELLEISNSYYSEIRSGKKSGTQKVEQFSRLLNVSVAYLLGEDFLVPITGDLVMGEKGIEVLSSTEPLRYADLSEFPGFSPRPGNWQAVRIISNILIPLYKPGDLLIYNYGSGNEIIHGDHVILHTDPPLFKIVEISPSGYTTFRCWRPDIPVIAANHGEQLPTYDKILYVIRS